MSLYENVFLLMRIIWSSTYENGENGVLLSLVWEWSYPPMQPHPHPPII